MGTEIREQGRAEAVPASGSALPGGSGSAHVMLLQAKQDSVASGDLVRLILAGTRRVDSWLIENRILPMLLKQDAKMLRFTQAGRDAGRRCAAIVPLHDGEAFGCSTSDRWLVLERLEALSAMQYIGLRYALENHWARGFEAHVQVPGEAPRPLSPSEVARLWEEVTGTKPKGFEESVIDEMEAIGLQLIGRVFNTQGRLGL